MLLGSIFDSIPQFIEYQFPDLCALITASPSESSRARWGEGWMSAEKARTMSIPESKIRNN